jgi:hypothetical protein
MDMDKMPLQDRFLSQMSLVYGLMLAVDVHTIFCHERANVVDKHEVLVKKAKLGICIPINCKHVSVKLKINMYIIILENFLLSKRKRVSESWVWMNHH